MSKTSAHTTCNELAKEGFASAAVDIMTNPLAMDLTTAPGFASGPHTSLKPEQQTFRKQEWPPELKPSCA